MTSSLVPRLFPTGTKVEQANRALVLASFLSSLGFNFVFPLLPLYVREISGPGVATALWAGLALAATPLAGAIVSPFWGSLADRFGYRPMLLRALVSTSILIGLMGLPNAPWQLVLLRALAGALGSFQAVAMGAMSASSKPEDLSTAISRLQMAQVAGAIVGPLAGGGVAAWLGMRFAPVAGGVVLALGSVLVARWFHEPAKRRVMLKGGRPRFSPTYIWLPIVTLLAVQFTDGSFNPILPLLLAQSSEALGAIAGVSGVAASLSACAAAVSAGISGRLLRRGLGYRAMAAMVVAPGALALAGVVAPSPWGVVVTRVLCGGAAAGVAVAAYSAGGLRTPPEQRGSAYGWLSSSSMIGYAASPLAAGMLAAVDLRAILVLDAVLCLASAVGWGWSRGPIGAAPRAPAAEPRSAPPPAEPSQSSSVPEPRPNQGG